ncbi:hypothetical protein GY45DRAFT_1379241, partial [Cubamyces sp. BRFM 1775]
LLSFFNKQYKRKRGAAAASTAPSAVSLDPTEHDLQEILGDIESESEALQRLILQSGQAEHDEAAVMTIRQRAVREMAQRGVTFTSAQAAAAIRVLPKHAALAIKTRDNGHIRDTFERLVSEHPADRRYGEYRTLSPRNVTRWGSDYRLLQSYHALRVAVGKLLDLPLNLGNLRLTAQEQVMADNLRDMLVPIEEVTKIFQAGKIPLLMDVIPTYDLLQRDFHAMADDSTLPPICRVAAYAAYLMTRKYYTRLEECDAYYLSIGQPYSLHPSAVMCPHRKLWWFTSNGWAHDDIAQIRDTALRRFDEKFKPGTQVSPPLAGDQAGPTASTQPGPFPSISRWRSQHQPHPSQQFTLDSMDSMAYYLSLPPQPLPPGMTVLQFWESQRTVTPCLAAMGLAYTSAPGMLSCLALITVSYIVYNSIDSLGRARVF